MAAAALVLKWPKHLRSRRDCKPPTAHGLHGIQELMWWGDKKRKCEPAGNIVLNERLPFGAAKYFSMQRRVGGITEVFNDLQETVAHPENSVMLEAASGGAVRSASGFDTCCGESCMSESPRGGRDHCGSGVFKGHPPKRPGGNQHSR